jgi:hypothetical protein
MRHPVIKRFFSVRSLIHIATNMTIARQQPSKHLPA